MSTDSSDSYARLLEEHWEKIVGLYSMFEEKGPVMLFDVDEHKIYACPFDEFMKEMSERDADLLQHRRERILSGEEILVFVRDTEKRKLVSYRFPRASE